MKSRIRQGFAAIALGLLAPAAYAQQDHGAEASASLGGLQPEFNVMGFGDVGYLSADSGTADGFAIGQVVAHVTASLDQSFRVFGEFSMTARDSDYKTSVERLIVRYDFSDLIKLSGGRYHSPIGYWNSAFHHGAWLQTTVSRPEVVKFGSRIVPIHFVGVLAEGTFTETELGISYAIGFGNGRHEDVAQAGDAGDINGDNAWMVQVNVSPSRWYGMHAGLGYYSDTVSPSDRPEIDEKTFSAYLAWERESPEFIAEYIHSEHEFSDNGNLNGDSDAWYVQLAYRLSGSNRQWKPYVRYEKTEIDDGDPLLGDQALNYDATILGARWDFSPYAALKAEYRNEEFNFGGKEDNFRLQLSFVLANL